MHDRRMVSSSRMPKKAQSKPDTGVAPKRKGAKNQTLPVGQTAPKQQITTAALDDSIGYLLKRAQFSTYGEFAAAMDDFEIRPSQYATLVLIHANPGLKQSALGGTLGIQKANFVALLDGLEVRGLTERRRIRSQASRKTWPGKVRYPGVDVEGIHISECELLTSFCSGDLFWVKPLCRPVRLRPGVCGYEERAG